MTCRFQDKRNAQVGRQMEQASIEKILNGTLTSTNLKFSGDKGKLEEYSGEKQTTASKLERKRADLERLKQRLDTLQKIR